MTNEFHRRLNSILILVLLFIGILYALNTEDRLEECSDLLYEHLFEVPAPKDIHELAD